jgi:hypothetical protein
MTTNLNRRLARYAPAVLSLFRLGYGVLFAGYGSMILFSWPVRPTWPVQVGAWPGWYAGLIRTRNGAADRNRIVHPRRRIHRLGRNGGRLFLYASAALALADR